MNHDTGWEGYDFIINRNRKKNRIRGKVVNNSWEFEEAGGRSTSFIRNASC